MTVHRIVTTARDAGAAAALAPVIRLLIDEGRLTVSTVVTGKAAGVFERHGLPVLAFPELPESGDVVELLTRERARVVLTGTSFKPERDGVYWAAAAELGIPSVAVVDHWVNYAERFSVERPFDTLPDVIAVMDDVTAERFRELGCPPERVRVTGQPYFDELVREGNLVGREEARRELGIEPGRLVVVFASEPQARFWGASPDEPGYLGYTEHDALNAVHDALGRIAPEALLVVKLHPLEAPDAFVGLAGQGFPEVRVVRAYPPTHLIAAADVVTGMTSVLQLESALLGIPTISVCPGARRREFFLDVHRDLIDSVEQREDTYDALRRGILHGPSEHRPHAAFGEQAIERVANVVYELADRETARAK